MGGGHRHVPELQRQGVRAIVVLIHEGGVPTGDYNECPGISGATAAVPAGTSSGPGTGLGLGGRLVAPATLSGRLLALAVAGVRRGTGNDQLQPLVEPQPSQR